MRFARCFRWRLAPLLAAVVGLYCLSVVGQKPPENSGDSSKYVEAEVCQGCHEDAYKSFANSAHAKTSKNKKSAGRGCEGCHGPGADHVEAGGDPGKIWAYAGAAPATILERCGRCHQDNPGKAHAEGQPHCLTCHSIHHFQQQKFLLLRPQS